MNQFSFQLTGKKKVSKVFWIYERFILCDSFHLPSESLSIFSVHKTVTVLGINNGLEKYYGSAMVFFEVPCKYNAFDIKWFYIDFLLYFFCK